jgi:hypothetical protein
MFKEIYLFVVTWFSKSVITLDDTTFEYSVQANYGTSEWLVLVTNNDKLDTLWDKINAEIADDYSVPVSLAIVDAKVSPSVIKRLGVTLPVQVLYIKARKAYKLPEPKSVEEMVKFLHKPDFSKYEHSDIPLQPGYWSQIFKRINILIAEYPFISMVVIILITVLIKKATDKCKELPPTEETQSARVKKLE